MLGVRLDPETEKALDSLARQTHRSKSDIAREAIARHVQRHDIEIARARWKAISASERADPDLTSMLDGMATDISRDL